MPTPDIDIAELRKLEAAADAPLQNAMCETYRLWPAEWRYRKALRNAAPALLAKWEECERLKDECHELQEMVSAEQERANERGNEIVALKSRLAAAEAVVSAARDVADIVQPHMDDHDSSCALNNLHRALSTYEGKSE